MTPQISRRWPGRGPRCSRPGSWPVFYSEAGRGWIGGGRWGGRYSRILLKGQRDPSASWRRDAVTPPRSLSLWKFGVFEADRPDVWQCL